MSRFGLPFPFETISSIKFSLFNDIINIVQCFCIHVIFSWAQIGRSAIFGREIGVPDREIFSRQKIFQFNAKTCLFASP